MCKKTIVSLFVVVLTASFAMAANPAVNVDVSTPNVRVQVGTPQAPPTPQVRVIEKDRVIIKEEKKDRGKHKGHYKKHKKHKKNDD